ncbi:hypothetical protein IFM89_037554 [Coptis chinensis]|uniref:Uncharacterized protein n=1 Tax=Coptis chinensis TaxID=261450 RepID=A0A835HZH4_9MAGN|nr:hypothetical protein IFM89_037554 [Coptis chinensis]
MGTLSFLPLSISSLLLNHNRHHSSPKTHLLNHTLSSKTSSVKLPTITFPRKRLLLRCNSKDSYDSKYVDEDGVVEDMDGFMNQLSLEYESVWDTKPSWSVMFGS